MNLDCLSPPCSGCLTHQLVRIGHALLRRQPLLSTDLAPLFDAQPTFMESLRHGWRRFDGRVAALQFLAGIAWVFGFGVTAYQLLQLRVTGLLADWSHWEKTLLGLGGALAATALLWLGTELRHPIRAALQSWKRHFRVICRRARQQPLTPERDLEQIEELIRRNLLLGVASGSILLALLSA